MMSLQAYEDRIAELLRIKYGWDNPDWNDIGPLVSMAHQKGREADAVAEALAARFPRPFKPGDRLMPRTISGLRAQTAMQEERADSMRTIRAYLIEAAELESLRRAANLLMEQFDTPRSRPGVELGRLVLGIKDRGEHVITQAVRIRAGRPEDEAPAKRAP